MTYQLLAGRLPYDATSLTELALMQQREYPVRLDELTPEVPRRWRSPLQRALELEPASATPRAEDMRSALHEGARGVAPAGGDDGDRRDLDAARPTSRPAATRARSRPARRLQPQAPRTPARRRSTTSPTSTRRCARAARPAAAPRRSRPGRRHRARSLGIIARRDRVRDTAAQGGSGDVQLTPVDGDSVTEIVDQTTELIDNNTR